MAEISDDRLLGSLVLEAERVARTDERVLDTPVPWCGDWRTDELIGHLGSVQRWATALSTEPGRWVKRREMDPPPTGAAVLAWYADGLQPMRSAFDGADLDVTVQTWAGEQPRRWWLRRLTHETAVHRWDVDAATDPSVVVPIEVELAIDGVDELFELFLPRFADGLVGPEATMHLHATDAAVAGEWTVRFTTNGVEVTHEHTRGDVAVRAPASELLLLLWNRRDPGDIGGEVFGDATVLDRWKAAARA